MWIHILRVLAMTQMTLDWYKPNNVDILIPEFELLLYDDSFFYEWIDVGYLQHTIVFNDSGELLEVVIE